MRVLHLDEQRTWRGGEQQASWLIAGLLARGVECHVAGRAETPWLRQEYAREVKRLALPLRGEWDLVSAARLARYVRDEGIAILHAHTSHAHTMAVLAARLAKTPKVVAHRRVSFAPNNNPLTRWKYRNAERMVCVSDAVARVLHEGGYLAPQVVTIHSSLDLARIDAARAEAHGGRSSVTTLFSAGALVPHKDHATLLEAFAVVVKSRQQLRLLIAGEGELRAVLEAQIARLGLAEHVTLLGHREDVPQLMCASDLYVSSSWSEGLGTSVLEALAAEVPTVATEAGGVNEMVLHGETGLLVGNRNPEALAAAILQMLSEPERAREMARAGRRLVEERYTTERMVERTHALYRELLELPVRDR